MIIRPSFVEDAEQLCMIHKRSIRELCQNEYTPEQIEQWADPKRPEFYRDRIATDAQVTFTAVLDNKIVGFVRFWPESNELCSVFVDPDYARHGVGSALMLHAEKAAIALGLTYFWLHASLTAVPFYQSLGYIKQEAIVQQFRSGGSIPGLRMEKQF